MQMNKEQITAIIFDFDNTLIDAWASLYKAYDATFSFFNLDTPSRQDIKSKFACSMKESFPQIFGNNYLKAASVFYEQYEKNAQELVALPHVIDMLDEIHNNQNIIMAVLSNKKGPLLREEIKRLGWEKYFKIIVGADDLPFNKPSTAPVKYIANYCKFDITKKIWFIGDTEVDIECANNAGCYSVLYNNTKEIYTGIAQPDLTIASHVDLLEIVKGVK